MRCPNCGEPWIAGLTSCPTCGGDRKRAATADETMAEGLAISFGWTPPTPESLALQAASEARIEHDNEQSREWTKARALEYAGRVDEAAAIYEALAKGRNPYRPAIDRLPILYGKAKRWADEERATKHAIRFYGDGLGGQRFVLRLARIEAQRRAGKR